MKKVVKVSVALLFTQIIQRGMNIISLPLYTRLLNTEQYGMVTVFFSWYELLLIISGFCVASGALNNGLNEYRDDQDRFSWSMCTLVLAISLIIDIFVVVHINKVSSFTGLPNYLIGYMLILASLQEMLEIYNVKQRFNYKYKSSSIITISLAIVSPILGVVFIKLFPNNKVGARIIGATGVFIIAFCIVLVYLACKAHFNINLTYWKYAWKINLPLIPHYLSLNIMNHMDRVMIASLVGESFSGIYSVAYSGAALICIVWQSINAIMIPWIFSKCEESNYDVVNLVTRKLIVGYGICCAFFMLLAPEVMIILAPSSYGEGINVIPPIVVGFFFVALYSLFSIVLNYYKKNSFVMVGSVIAASANIVLNWIFIPKCGYYAASYTTMICYMIQALIDYFAMKRVVNVKIYDARIMLMLSAVLVCICLFLGFVYEYTIVRIILLLLCLFVLTMYLVSNRMVIKSLLRKEI